MTCTNPEYSKLNNQARFPATRNKIFIQFRNFKYKIQNNTK